MDANGVPRTIAFLILLYYQLVMNWHGWCRIAIQVTPAPPNKAFKGLISRQIFFSAIAVPISIPTLRNGWGRIGLDGCGRDPVRS